MTDLDQALNKLSNVAGNSQSLAKDLTSTTNLASSTGMNPRLIADLVAGLTRITADVQAARSLIVQHQRAATPSPD